MGGADEGSASTDLALGATVDNRAAKTDGTAVPCWLGGRYRAKRVLGRDGVGAVYLAVEEALACEVALKRSVVPGNARTRLRDEPRLAQQVTHAKVVGSLTHPAGLEERLEHPGPHFYPLIRAATRAGDAAARGASAAELDALRQGADKGAPGPRRGRGGPAEVTTGLRAILAGLVLSAAGCGLIPHPELVITVTAQGDTMLSPGQMVGVFADVRHSGGMPAVTWSLSGSTCPTDCGTLSDNMMNGAMYTAPSTVAASFTVTITATAVADPSKSASLVLSIVAPMMPPPVVCPSGDEALLDGSYAFLLRGAGMTQTTSTAAVGSFEADGRGGIVAGREDENRVTGGPRLGLSLTGTYSVGADARGCLNLQDSEGTTMVLRIALSGVAAGVVTHGRIIEFDDSSGTPTGTRGEGFLERRDPAGFGTDRVAGSYAFGLRGSGVGGGPFVEGGALTAKDGAFSDVSIDTDQVGALATRTHFGGTYAIGGDGRGELHLNVGVGFAFVGYVVSAAEVLLLSSDTVDASHQLASGELRAQTASRFDNAALSAPAVLAFYGYDVHMTTHAAAVGRLTPNGMGSFDAVIDQNIEGTYTAAAPAKGTYVVDPNGRVVMTGLGANPPVLYLTGASQGFVIGTDVSATFGSLELQTGGPFSNASLSGPYAYGTEGGDVGRRVTAVGTMDFDGTTTEGTEDDAVAAGLMPDLSWSGLPYAFAGDGRGTLDAKGHTVGYIVSPGKLVYINTPAGRPRLVIVEK